MKLNKIYIHWINVKKLAFFPIKEYHLNASSFGPLIKLKILVMYVDVFDGFNGVLSMVEKNIKL